MSDDFFSGPMGYDEFERFFGSRFKQGTRTVYSLDLSVSELVAFLPKPDPEKPLDVTSAQRRIAPKRSSAFAEYVRDNAEWVSPALLLRAAPDVFEWQAAGDALNTGSVQFGKVGIRKNAKAEIQILDGQHRTLGFHLLWEDLTKRINLAKEQVAKAKKDGDPTLQAAAESTLQPHLDRRNALSTERVSVQILVISTTDDARRLFVEINDNAKGVTGSVKARFDDRSLISRATNIALASNELVKDRTDLESDRVSGGSPYLLGAKHVSDMLRALTVGHGRVAKKLEAEGKDTKVAEEFDLFTNALVEAFPVLEEVIDGDLEPSQLRSQHLVGSNVMLRALALAWFELRQTGWTPEGITKALVELDPHMTAPVFADDTDTWFKTGLFAPSATGSASPTSRAQDLKALSNFLVWALQKGSDASWHRATASKASLLPSSSTS